MGTYFIYLKLELKKACRILPAFLTGAIVLALLLGTIALLSSRVLYGNSVLGRITVGVVLPKEDAIAKQAVSMISSMDSVKSICDFTYLEEKAGKKQLREGDIYALMIIPPEFVQSIINGTNIPITILLPDNKNMEAMIFKELTDAGAKTLSIAQAAIYASDEFCTKHGMEEAIPGVEAALNRIYLKYTLSREGSFRDLKVSATGEISAIQYYICSALTLFLLLCGITAASILEPQRPVLSQKLKSIGIGRWKVILSRIVSTAFLLSIVFAIILTGFCTIGLLNFQWSLPVLSVLICLSVASMIVFAYELAGSQIAGVCFLFLASVTMLFISGGLVPLVFLPKGIQNLSQVMPTAVLLQGMKMIIMAEPEVAAMLQIFLLGTGFYGLAVIVRR